KNPLVIYRDKTDELEYIKGSRKSIGGMRAWRSKVRFEDCKTTVSSGDVLYLFTDGILDQHSDKRERYTRERLFNLLKSHGGKPISDLVQVLQRDLENHEGKSKQTDDITFMAVKL
ncbi:MAG: serine/threonine-protein phosphatase, partial [Bacteroidales bacterium]|nr:serine/threonine-protein phosphatase [Bacteroidales bacterium]